MNQQTDTSNFNWIRDNNGNILWRKNSLQPNRTYLALDRREKEVMERNIPYETTAPPWYRDPVLPNYKRLNLLNDGTWHGEYEDNVLANEMEKWHARHSIATQIGLTNRQLQRVHGWGIQKETRVQGIRREVVHVCICGIVCYEDGVRTHPNHSPRDPSFETVREAVGVSEKMYRRWFGKLCHRMNITLQKKREHPEPPTEPKPWSLWSEASPEEVVA